MTTDRELLELAAKAAEIEGGWGCGDKWGIVNIYKIAAPVWNPLTDDGDALRLAVKMRIIIDHQSEGEESVWVGNSRVQITEPGNTFAATRRAIVRAAAEIGRAMP